jgi:hypothetical protein
MSRALTLKYLEDIPRANKLLAFNVHELANYEQVMLRYNIHPLCLHPDKATNWGVVLDAIIHWASENGKERLFILDDDLRFSYSTALAPDLPASNIKLPSLPVNLAPRMFEEGWEFLTPECPHVGFTKRGFAQTLKQASQWGARIMWAHGLHVPTIVANDLHFSWEGIVMGDFYFQLCLHEKGLTNHVFNKYQVDDAVGPYENKGGCNVYRNPAMRRKAVELLYERFPDAVEPRTKSSPQGELWDVTLRLGNVRRSNV